MLNYQVGRTGADDLKPLLDHNWYKDFTAGVIDVKSTVTETAKKLPTSPDSATPGQ